jgi:DNA repair exonuclease SbcCD ATPase subunit
VNNAKIKIAEMLAAGIINEKQAADLLAALSSDQCVNSDYADKMADFNSRFKADKFDEKIAFMQARRDQLKAKVVELKTQLKAMKLAKKVASSEEEADDLDIQIDSLTDEIEDIEDSIDDIDENIEDIEDAKEDTADAAADMADLDNDLNELERSIADVMAIARDEISINLGVDLKNAADATTAKGDKYIDNSSDEIHIHTPSSERKNFANCTIYIKYLKGAFRYSGDFPASKIAELAENVKLFMSERAFAELMKQLKKQFVGDYRYICKNEILKVVIK